MEFLIALSQIMMVNIVLSGDNAVVIAMASRCLPAKQQKMTRAFLTSNSFQRRSIPRRRKRGNTFLRRFRASAVALRAPRRVVA